MTFDLLLEVLRAAFPPEPIAAAGAFGPTTYCDTHEYEAAIDGRTWEQLDRPYISRRSDALSFLAATHVHALLPVYLRLMLVSESPWPVHYTLIHELTKPKSPAWHKSRFGRLVVLLSPEQRRVVALFLRQFIELHPDDAEAAQLALDRYWAACD